MIPQSSMMLNTSYFAELTAQIEAIDVCADLQQVVTSAFGSLSALKAAITAQLAQLEPILALLTAPGANLGAIVSWITNFINAVLMPLTGPANTFTMQLSMLATEIGNLIAAITAAAGRITSCSISIPAI